jgi:hypothetical protein
MFIAGQDAWYPDTHPVSEQIKTSIPVAPDRWPSECTLVKSSNVAE